MSLARFIMQNTGLSPYGTQPDVLTELPEDQRKFVSPYSTRVVIEACARFINIVLADPTYVAYRGRELYEHLLVAQRLAQCTRALELLDREVRTGETGLVSEYDILDLKNTREKAIRAVRSYAEVSPTDAWRYMLCIALARLVWDTLLLPVRDGASLITEAAYYEKNITTKGLLPVRDYAGYGARLSEFVATLARVHRQISSKEFINTPWNLSAIQDGVPFAKYAEMLAGMAFYVHGAPPPQDVPKLVAVENALVLVRIAQGLGLPQFSQEQSPAVGVLQPAPTAPSTAAKRSLQPSESRGSSAQFEQQSAQKRLTQLATAAAAAAASAADPSSASSAGRAQSATMESSSRTVPLDGSGGGDSPVVMSAVFPMIESFSGQMPVLRPDAAAAAAATASQSSAASSATRTPQIYYATAADVLRAQDQSYPFRDATATTVLSGTPEFDVTALQSPPPPDSDSQLSFYVAVMKNNIDTIRREISDVISVEEAIGTLTDREKHWQEILKSYEILPDAQDPSIPDDIERISRLLAVYNAAITYLQANPEDFKLARFAYDDIN
jgi:hypothetical protein